MAYFAPGPLCLMLFRSSVPLNIQLLVRCLRPTLFTLGPGPYMDLRHNRLSCRDWCYRHAGLFQSLVKDLICWELIFSPFPVFFTFPASSCKIYLQNVHVISQEFVLMLSWTHSPSPTQSEWWLKTTKLRLAKFQLVRKGAVFWPGKPYGNSDPC